MEKIIHQTWKDKNLNEFQFESTKSVRRFFKGYEYKFWTDQDNLNLIQNKYIEFFGFYNDLLSIEKSDFSRYLHIFEFGGIYLDMDIEMYDSSPITEFDTDHDVFLYDQSDEFSRNRFGSIMIDPFFLCGKKQTPFFYDLCKSIKDQKIYNNLLKNLSFDVGPYKPLYKTGPYMLTEFYKLYQTKYKIKLIRNLFRLQNSVDEVSLENPKGIHYQKHSWLIE